MKYDAVWEISGKSASRDITMVLGSIHIPVTQHGIVLEIVYVDFSCCGLRIIPQLTRIGEEVHQSIHHLLGATL
jgi:hypothetical protein